MSLLKIITETHFDEFKQKIEIARSASIRIDGSVDRTQLDKIYILLKIVDEFGDLETLFIGIGQQINRGAAGLFDATKIGMIQNVGQDF